MNTHHQRSPAGAAILTILAAALLPTSSIAATAVQHTYGSDASVAAIDLSVLGVPLGGAPIARSTGMGSPSYYMKNDVVAGTYSIPLPIVLGQPPAAIGINIPAAQTHAAGHNMMAGAFEASGKQFTRSAAVTLGAVGGLPSDDALVVALTRVQTVASATTDAAGTQTDRGMSKIKELKLSGTLIGKVIDLKNVIGPGMVFSNDVLTVTVGDSTTTTAHGLPQIAVTAVTVHLLNAPVLGSLLTGTLALGNASAY